MFLAQSVALPTSTKTVTRNMLTNIPFQSLKTYLKSTKFSLSINLRAFLTETYNVRCTFVCCRTCTNSSH